MSPSSTTTSPTSKTKSLDKAPGSDAPVAIVRTEPLPPPSLPAKRGVSLSKAATSAEQKKAAHRPGKPIINWFQRKLGAGSSLVKPKRAENQPLVGQGRVPSTIPLRVSNRISSAPLPHGGNKHLSKLDAAKRKTISLNEDDDGELYVNDIASERSSLAGWSPTSALEADEDASVRPLPPSVPPSPSPSSSSFASDPRTFRSLAASTKPTTLLSIDLNGNGMAHIAQAPPAPISRLHVRSPSTSTSLIGAGVTFSALPPSPTSRAHHSHSNSGSSQSVGGGGGGGLSSVQAPLHTSHHPRNNPRPSSPPQDNASVLTLASSAFGIPVRAAVAHHANTAWSSGPPSALADSISHFGGSITYADAESTSQYLLGDDDVDASVRALRPRSSRRGSWESEASRWSARGVGAGTPSLARDGRSIWTSQSTRTGGVGDMYEKSDAGGDENEEDEAPENDAHSDSGSQTTPAKEAAHPLTVPLPPSTDDLTS
ncbi:unnamed protein product [Mycena citricolor]|uniref:Uncharacterized protein n=1 Tax=Mycena citricolor TaxID=2018698 RepID=A0AAD2GV55_9AGAR|nr:unnamed protein product [Mycena citricolor]